MSIKDTINKARKKKKQAQNVDTAKKVGVGLGIGAAIGSSIGLLFAPKSGKQTRDKISNVTKDTVDNLKENATEMGGKISKVVGEGKERIKNIRKDTKETAEEIMETTERVLDEVDEDIDEINEIIGENLNNPEKL
ncbi:Gas vesicle protein [Desulfonispora thiosulfatigenes DSM 11270]|uniref:Gas vesicle protein n=1 Tax=Desulfonispora thiosulfatigenes DSM 11270 TaxID=656914 RepID=A0A1W1UXG2_DESTI|nr:YtxH domain-containing protein [Desulfonispora thiosulfatigenes]SMB85767.1 Gas vesicle protein [Desulfonispora thiosulfatigenes DSM 11270]